MKQVRHLTGNQVDMPITNYGTFCQMYGFWPKEDSNENYIFGAGIWVGAVKDYPVKDTLYSGGGILPDTFIGDISVSCGYDFYSGRHDFIPGPPDSQHIWDNYWDSTSHPEDCVYLSTDTTDTAEWPVRDSLGNPIILSDEDSWCEFNDLCDSMHTWDQYGNPLGIHIIQRSFAWNTDSLQNMIFMLYTIKNVSADTLKYVYVGPGMDADVGIANNNLIGCDISRELGYTYNTYQGSGWGAPPPYYVGEAFLKGPIADDTVYVYGYNVNAGPIATILPGEPLPLTSFTKCTIDYDANDDKKRYLMLAGYNIETEQYSPFDSVPDSHPADKRMVMGCGPFTMMPGEIDTFEFAIIFSNGNTGGLDYLKQEVDWARKVAGVAVQEKKSKNSYVLQSTPNPFSYSADIKYYIPVKSQVSLKVYDIAGRVVKILVNGQKEAGSYNVSLSSKGLVTGIYFARFETGDYKETKKLILVK